MPGARYTLRPTGPARRDLIDIRRYTRETYGSQQANAYDALIKQAFKDIAADPFRPGSKERPEIGEGVRSYHISLSRERAGSDIKTPRHFVLYYLPTDAEIAVSRVIHDSRDLARHVPRDHIDKARDFKEARRRESKERGDRDR
ncbi:type II toxin-antitoxin system RelE/ParE family toxin [Thalassobaculum litoreum]|uniref:Toxin ParE1/3/4 n=1 Tax=Thalassobaculum litoreum DSM 18839 TaxID=1123362 RepID=A0A8G2EZQ3_9PROT|nr:type II toxin-antitoxin system RelE/ParE family toxin [Thalassobaculum litoreum]SDG14283.1 toxin ParE1/3/4 [Thalassobaculum litoreum DSM 18839]